MIDRAEMISRIVNREAPIPDYLKYRDFKAFLDGYIKCQHDILDIIEGMPTIEKQRFLVMENGEMIPLREQDPVKPITQDAWPTPVKVCGSCGGYITYTAGRPRYCPNCGCEVNWNDWRGEDLPTLREDGQAGDGDVCDEIVLGDGEDLPGVPEAVAEEAAGTGGR